MNPLESYKKNITSQWGEDGIIEEILRRIGAGNKFCVEFGAWDGQHLSNTWHLWHDLGWSAMLIEGNKERFERLRGGLNSYPNVMAHQALVKKSGPNSLDEILKHADQKTPDLLSIDIDGDDYYIFQSLKIRPRIVIIEYNPTIPPFINLTGGEGQYFGSSAKAIVELGAEKGYVLAAITETNCILVLENDFQKLNILPPNLEKIFPSKHLTYLISSYDGLFFVNQTPPYSKMRKIRRKKSISFKCSGSNAPILVPLKIKLGESGWGKIRKAWYVVKCWTKKIPGLQSGYQKILIAKKISDWKKGGQPAPPPHQIKQQIVLEYGQKFTAETLVETGTYLGEMIEATQKYFRQIISIELDHRLAEKGKTKNAHRSHVTILEGDSGVLLAKVIKNISGKTLFWLDAHYSGGITALGNQYTPILSEMEIIASYPQANSLILVDDARLFTGQDGYPLMAEFKQFVRAQFPSHNWEIADDIIRLVPNKLISPSQS